MAADFYDILLPPQTLESLDNWGDLDSLPLSLDSAAWETAGIYGLTIADGAVAGGAVAEFQRIRLSAGVLSAKSGQSIVTVRIRQTVVTGAAKSTASVTSQRVRLGSGTSEAVATAQTAGLRIRTDRLSATGTLSGTLIPLVIGNDRLYGWAYSGGSLAGQRVRTASGTLSASTGGKLESVRIRTAELSGMAVSGGTLSADTGPRLTGYAKLSGSLVGYILGHEWQEQARPQEGEWRPETATPEPWQGMAGNSAEWAQNEQKTQGWNELEHGSGEWVKHEQSGSGIWELGAGRGPAEWTASAGSEELHSGKEGVSTSSWHRADAVSAAVWTGEGRLQQAQWGRLDNRHGYGWRAVRA